MHHFFKHPTQELAEAEARRMAKLRPGNYFAVYASGAVFYEEVPPPPPGEEQPLPAAQSPQD